MSSPFLHILYFLNAFVFLHGQSLNCREEFRKCGTQQIYGRTSNLVSVVNEEELQKLCKLTKEWTSCMRNYYQECGEPEDSLLMNTVSIISRRVMVHICTPGDPFIPRFLNFSACYPKVSEEYIECSRKFAQDRDILKSSLPPELKLQEYCCYFKYFLHCIGTVVQSKCGADAANTAQELRSMAGGEQMTQLETICSQFSYGSPGCSFPHSASRTVTGQPVDCETKPLECGLELIYLKTHGLLSAVNEKQLLKACNSTRRYIACVVEYAEKCRKPESKSKVEEIFGGLRRLMNSICTPGNSFIPRFLNYTACYWNFADKYIECHRDFQLEREKILQASIYAGFKQQQFCCYYKYFEHCVELPTEHKCGQYVAETGKEVIAILSGDRLENTCLEFDYNSPECTTWNETTTARVFSQTATSETTTSVSTTLQPSYESDVDQCFEPFADFEEKPGFPSELTDEEYTTFCNKILPETLTCAQALEHRCSNANDAEFIRNTTTVVQTYLDACFSNETTLPGCSESDLNECMKHLVDFMKKPEFPIDLTDEELRMACDKIIPESLACEREFSQKCFIPREKAEFENIAAETQKLLERACSPSGPKNIIDCKSKEPDQCIKEMENITQKDVISLTTLQGRASVCIIYGKVLQCQKNFNKRCLDFHMAEKYEGGIDKAQEVLLQNCKPDPSGECVASQKCADNFYYLQKHSILEAVTECELERACDFTEEAISCMTNYTEKCFDAKIASMVKKAFERQQRIIDSVCVPGDPFKFRFLNFTACSPKFADKVKECEDYYLNKLETIDELSLSEDEDVQQSCCIFHNYRHCARTAMESKCGNVIANTGLEVISKIFFPQDFVNFCLMLKYTTSECFSFDNSSTVSNTASRRSSSTTTATSTTNDVLKTLLPFTNTAVRFGSFPNLYFLVFLPTAVLYH